MNPARYIPGRRIVAAAGIAAALAVCWLGGTAALANAEVPSASAEVPSASASDVVATTTKLTVTPSDLTYGADATLRATLTREGISTPLAGQAVRFRVRPAGTTTWTTLDTVKTDAKGVARLVVKPGVTTDYRADFRGTADAAASRSGRRTVTVRPKVSAAASRTSIKLGRATSISGKVTPNHAGETVRLQQRRSDGTWKTIDTRRLTADSTYAFTYRPTKGGTKVLRVRLPAHADHATGTSAKVKVEIRRYVFPVRPASAASYGRAHHDYPATDIFAPCGTTVVAPTAGVVHEVNTIDRWDPAINAGATRGGLSVSIVGTDGVRYYGSHFQTIDANVKPGVKVATGQVLGTVGRTGSARFTPCHLHFGISPPCGTGDWQVRRGVVAPWPYLDAWKAGTDRSPAREVAAWRSNNPHLCPGG